MAEPIQESTCSATTSTSRRAYTTNNERSITFGRDHVPEPFDSEKLPVTLISEIQRFLRVANLIEEDEPRVAYLCRFHAFEVAHNLDRNGRGVRQFKTALLQRLEQDEEVTFRKRKERIDLRELRRAYRQERLTKARAIASVLFEVLDTVSRAAGVQALAGSESSDVKSELFVSYNILPLDQGGIHHAIMQLPEIKVAVAAVRDVRGLPFLEDCRKQEANLDLFKWLQFCFGFQKGNVANQREHLILLLANMHVRQTQKQVLVPKMAYELHSMLTGAVSMTTGEKVMPAYQGDSESFLNNVVFPVYEVIPKIKPLISPTRQIMAIGVKDYDWHELFPKDAHLHSGEEVYEFFISIEAPLFASKHSIHFPLPDSDSLLEKIRLLTGLPMIIELGLEQGQQKSFVVYVLSWVVIAFIFLLVKVGQVMRPKIEGTGLWHFTRVFARAYDFGMGVVLFTPLASLAWLPIISAFQTRFLFTEAFSRRLQIQPILAGKKNH
ncbi:hypothetical protein RND71_024300 [Anisodus tanguticus]|uniref:Vta1/callose synthase N-terminal domain-containing protein n=1 Tax=Anisodus tanguticus TaxID=243964 RepID=A0AAE1VBI6_9SOLA|nr:hypothetical protein RND71_024300 [Anisodus tanguticus]